MSATLPAFATNAPTTWANWNAWSEPQRSAASKLASSTVLSGVSRTCKDGSVLAIAALASGQGVLHVNRGIAVLVFASPAEALGVAALLAAQRGGWA